MNDEIKILENIWFRLHCDSPMSKKYGLELEKNECKILLDYITNLQQKIEQYENPEDMTLFYMWLDTKAKDKIKALQQENERLKEQLEYLRSGEYLNQVKWERDLNENLNQTLGTELEDYKSRCEKAIKCIKNKYYKEEYERKGTFANKLKNILQNGSDDK